VSSASEDQNLKVEELIMCCVVSAATQQRVQRYISMAKRWIYGQRKLKKTGGSQKTASDYLTSGFNNIHLKCAHKTVWTVH
jgi:hypothetical protein